MCLYSKNSELQVSDKDIPCLKILEVVEDANRQKVYLTPYTSMRITPDMLSGKNLIRPEYISINNINCGDYDNINCGDYVRIGEGFIHTFDYDISIRDLISNIKVFEWVILEGVDNTLTVNTVSELGYPYPYSIYPNILNVTLCKCVIPAGTPFFRGSEHINSYFENHYASKKIRIIKILYEFTKEDYLEKDENNIYNLTNIIEKNRI